MPLQITETITARIRGLAAEQQLKNRHIAQSLGISTMGVSRRMRGETSFSAEQVYTLAGVFNVEIGVLYGEKPRGTIQNSGGAKALAEGGDE